MSLIFIGDIHQMWDVVERGLAALDPLPRAAVLLGDIQCDRPLDELAEPLLSRGIAVHWIFGNHDNDGGPEMWANLTAPERNPRTAPGALHARVRTIHGLRIAGLGGTFRPRVWHPPAPPLLRERAQLAGDLSGGTNGWPDSHVAALHHSLSSAAIWPEDYDRLAVRQADILVTHEAPSSLPAGNAALDMLARRMGARLIVHGHHHMTYRTMQTDGVAVMGIAAAWAMSPDGEVQWTGERPRPMPALRDGWSLEGTTSNR